MKAKAIERYPVPGYPTRPQVEQNPKLTQRSLSSPVRHLLETGISGAMTLLVPLSGCDRNPAGSAAAPSSQQAQGQDPSSSKTVPRPSINRKALLVAPIFDHGTGRGATGCVVFAPPVFLSEEEAMTIIKEELSKSGIMMEKGTTLFPKVQMHKEIDGCSSGKGTCKPLQMDLQDQTGQIHIEFVSERDNLIMTDKCPLKTEWIISTVHDYDLKGMADRMSMGLQQQADRGVFGIFYDPTEKIDMVDISRKSPSGQSKPTWDQIRVEAETRAKDQLRQQVRDFGHWLTENKVM
jgi:hypothetical protein